MKVSTVVELQDGLARYSITFSNGPVSLTPRGTFAYEEAPFGKNPELHETALRAAIKEVHAQFENEFWVKSSPKRLQRLSNSSVPELITNLGRETQGEIVTRYWKAYEKDFQLILNATQLGLSPVKDEDITVHELNELLRPILLEFYAEFSELVEDF